MTLETVTLLEAIDTTSGIHHAAFTGVERVTLIAKLHLDLRCSGTENEVVAAGTVYFGFREIFWMYFFFHKIHLASFNAGHPPIVAGRLIRYHAIH